MTSVEPDCTRLYVALTRTRSVGTILMSMAIHGLPDPGGIWTDIVINTVSPPLTHACSENLGGVTLEMLGAARPRLTV